MLMKKLTHPTASLFVGLVAGLLSQWVAATEVVVVDGSDALALVQADEVRFQSEMKDSAESLNQNLKATLEKELKQITAPKVQLAIVAIPTRG